MKKPFLHSTANKLDENTLNSKKYAENCLIIASVILTIASLLYDPIEIVAIPIDWFLISLLFYTKIPSKLDSYFQTTIFKKDLSIRLGLVFFPAIMFFLFLLSDPFGFFLLPKALENLNILDFSVSVLGTIAMVFISIICFSWRVNACPSAQSANKAPSSWLTL